MALPSLYYMPKSEKIEFLFNLDNLNQLFILIVDHGKFYAIIITNQAFIFGRMVLLHSAVILREFHGFLYITCALFIYLILTPIYVHKENKRKLLFVFILIVLSYLYLDYEDIDPVIYTLFLIPVSLSLGKCLMA